MRHFPSRILRASILLLPALLLAGCQRARSYDPRPAGKSGSTVGKAADESAGKAEQPIPPDYAWIDDTGRRARDRLRSGASGAVIGHCDWLASNLRWHGDALLVVHDWDSMIADSEAVLAGFAAALHSPVSADQPATVEETEHFLNVYCRARGQDFTPAERRQCWAAGVWTRAYDAKYQHAVGQPVTSLAANEAAARLRRAAQGADR